MFHRWGAFVYRFRRPVAILAVVVAVGLVVPRGPGLGVAERRRLAGRELGVGRRRRPARHGVRRGQELDDRAVPRRPSPGADATSPAFQAAIATALAGVADDPRVTGTVGYAETGDRRFISTAGDAAYVVIELDMTDEDSVAAVDDLRAPGSPRPPGYTMQLTGYGPITKDSAEQSEKDLQKAELVSLPIAALVLLFVFASVVAAGMPLLVAGLAIPSSLALVYLVAQQVEMSIFVLNIATMLGLALAIDYSLFIVSRYREELRRGRSVEVAVQRAVATSGKAVAFSGIAVAIGLSGLLLFAAPAIRSIGIAGALVVLCSVVYALTFLPAMLGILGHRVNALTVRGLRHRIRPVADDVEVARTSRWEHVARAVMARPIAVLIPTLAILLIAGIPFLRLQQGVPGAEIYPEGVESRDAYIALQTEFAPGETTPGRHPRRRDRVAHRRRHHHRAHGLRRERSRPSTGSIASRGRSPSRTRRPGRSCRPPRSPSCTPSRPASARPGSTRCSPGTCAGPPSGSTRSARCRPRSRPRPTSSRSSGRRRRVTTSRPRSAAPPRPATTSSSRRASARRTPSV